MKTARRVAALGTTVFSEFSALALRHRAVNLGQGFPDFDGPEEVKEAALKAIREGLNQYAVGAGALELREAIAEHSARFYGMTVDPHSMITVTSGATEAIFDAILGLIDPGDEAIVFQPFYDSYVPAIEMAGGTARYVRLLPADAAHPSWWFDPAELEAQFSERTKLLVLNTPHNPLGKVFTRSELEVIAELCLRHDVAVLADEVYEHLVYGPAQHLRIATLPGMAERTLTVSSGGKSFSFTGWKIGWAIGPSHLRAAVQGMHQFVTFASAAPFQHAIAAALRLPDAYFQGLKAEFAARRDRLAASLHRAGLPTAPVEGAYFLMADIRQTGFSDDFEFCRFLTEKVGVAAIPPSAFYREGDRALGRGMARFAFCKTAPVLDLADQRLSSLPSRLLDARR